MKHIFIKGEIGAPVFILLHGTGGTEESLLGVGNMLDNDASLLGIKGDVDESGMARYFRRLEEGVYDEEDLYQRAEILSDFIKKSARDHHFSLDDVVIVGYSNGANIGLHLLLNEADIYHKAILFHPMYPVANIKEADLSKDQIFMTYGLNDPIVSLEDSQYVMSILRDRDVQLSTYETSTHQLDISEVEAAKEWL